jgi:hypothetical protein
MYAIMSDRAWAPLLVGASTDLRAVDDTGRGAIDYAPPGSELERLLQEKAGDPPLRRLQDPAAAPESGRTDWLVTAGAAPGEGLEEPSDRFAGSRLTLDAPQLLRGEPLGLTLRLRNNGSEPLRLRVEGRISPAAYFVGGSHGVTVSNPYRAELIQSVRWPRLGLPAGAEGELRLKLLARTEEAGALDVRIEAVDPVRDVQTHFNLLRQPDGAHPDIEASELGDAGWTGLALVVALALLLGGSVWRRGAAKHRVFLFGLVGLFAVSGAVSLVSVEVLRQGIRARTSYEETSCTVLDRRLFPQTSVTANPGATRSRTSTRYMPRLALRYATSGGERISEGFATGLVNAGDLSDYALGQQYPCWYDPDDERRVVVRRDLGPLWVGLLVLPLALALGAGVVIAWELVLGRSDA